MTLHTVKLAALRTQVLTHFNVQNTKELRKKLRETRPDFDLSGYVFTRKAAWVDLIESLNIPVTIDASMQAQPKLKEMKQQVLDFHRVTTTKALRKVIAERYPGCQIERFDFRKKHYWQVLQEQIDTGKDNVVPVTALSLPNAAETKKT